METRYLVGCLPEHPALLGRLYEALRKDARIRPFHTAADALRAIDSTDLEVTVVALESDTYDRDIGWIRLLRQRFPRHPVVVWCHQPSITFDQFVEVTSMGIAGFAFQGVTDTRVGFAQVLASARSQTGTRPIEDRLADVFPPSMRPFFLLAIRRAADPLDVAGAAAALGVTRRTLHNRLKRLGLPGPQTCLVWGRLLAAAGLLDEPGRTVNTVALQLNFSSRQNLSNAFRRYVGANVTKLRNDQVSKAVEAEFRRIIQRGMVRAEAQRAKLPNRSTKRG